MNRLLNIRLLTVAVLVVITAVVATLVIAAPLGADRHASASDRFNVFSNPALTVAEVPSGLASGAARTRGDFESFRLLGDQLGRFRSQLYAFPANGDRNVCFAIEGASAVDPGMFYCYPPNGEKHFNAVALEGATDGNVGVQLFGVAFDDVESVRVEVAGEWRSVPLSKNGFYLDLPGVRHEQVGIVEATLSDGTTQTHNIQTGQ